MTPSAYAAYTQTRVVEASADGQFQLTSRPDGKWKLTCVIERDEFSLGIHEEELAKKLLRYCAAKPAQARHAMRRLHYNADEQPLEQLIEAAQRWNPKVRHEYQVTLSLNVALVGDEADLEELLRSKLNFIAAVKAINSIEVAPL